MFEEIRISDLTPAFIVNSGDLFVIEQANGTRSLTYSLLKASIVDDIPAGKTVELSNNGSFLQWRYSGDIVWKNLLNLDDLKGVPGDSIVWKGTWSDSSSYKMLEAVSYNGSSYICVNPVGIAGRDPSLLSSRPYWGILGQRGIDGAPGAAGIAGADGTDGSPIVWRGAYSASAIYYNLDAVSHNGNAYICVTTDTLGITNSTPGTDPLKWNLMVSKGDAGSAGASIVWRGTYLPNAEYSNLNAVFFNGQSYICKSSTPITNVSPTETTKWDVLVLKGDTGQAGAEGARTYNVSAITDNFVIDGANDPALNLLRGFTYRFALNIGSDTFWIQTSSGAYNAANIYNTGVTNNGGDGTETVTFSIPYNAPNTLYYVCGLNSTMGGTINITDLGPQGLPGTNALWNYRGAYASEAVYAVGDVVTHNGSTWYRKIVGTAGNAPATGSTFWDILALRGSDGLNGGGGGTSSEVGGVAWSATATYKQGDIVTTATRDTVWISIQDLNTNHEPTASPTWWKAAAADAVSLQLKSISTTAPTNGQILVFNSTSDKWEPANNTGGGSSVVWNYLGAYNPTTVYNVGDIVTHSGSLWYKKLAGAAGNAPEISSTFWDVLALKGTDGTGGTSALWNYRGTYSSATIYAVGDLVTHTGSLWYKKLDGAAGNDPITNSPFWDVLALKGTDGAPGTGGTSALWNYRGVYSTTVIYAVGDIVTHSGSLWYKKLAGAAGNDPEISSTFWDVLALKGTDGAPGTGGGTGADFLYSSKIDNNVTSNPLGGAAAALASVWKTRTIVDVLDLLLFPTQLPTYTVPVLTISGTQSGTREVGVGITQVLTLTGIKNDAGAFTTLTLKRGSTTISTSSSLSAVGATAVADQYGYVNPNSPNYSYTITYSDTLNVPYSTLSWSGTSVYGIGLVKKDNKNISDTRTFAVRSTSAPQSAASDLTTNNLSVTGIYPYFWGKVAATSGKPTAAQIAGIIQTNTPGTSNKVLADASGTITITFDASSEYVWVAHEASLTNKTKWYNTANNLGNIGAGNFIESPVQQNVTSPQGYWTAVSFDIYISGSATNTSGSHQLQN
jgi:hypothetical protein